MFGTLLGPLPRPDAAPGVPNADDLGDLVREVIRAQESAGLEPITDGGIRHPDLFDAASPAMAAVWAVADWSFAAGCTEAIVKQVLPGPYTLGRRLAAGAWDGDVDRDEAGQVTDECATALRVRILDLIAAGCAYIEVHEPDAVLIGIDETERRRFRGAHATLLEGVSGAHLSLAITGGTADAAGAETILAPGYQSLAVDLIAGPDNWRLVTAAPGSWGIVCGALPVTQRSDDGPELLVWATRYASSTNGRGLVRVGLATASGLERLPWNVAVRKMERLGRAAHLAGLPPGEELAGSLDHRALDLRTRAVGRRSTARPAAPGALRSTEPPPKGV